MSFLFTCPHCQTKTQVPEQYSGQAGECVTCGEPIQLPDFAADTTGTEPDVSNRSKPAAWIAAGVVAAIVLGSLLVAMIRYGGQSMNRITTNRARTSSIRNLEKIAEALTAYAADQGGAYPPSYSVDAGGKVLHSWRVLILPYLGEEELYNEFDLALPWDNALNLQAAQKIPRVYQHANTGSRSLFTQSAYYLITGPRTLFPKLGPLGPGDVADDPTQTILVTEANPIVPTGLWTEPIDLDFAIMQCIVGASSGVEAGGMLEDGVAFATVDGRGHFLPNSVEPMVFHALITPAGGERLPDDTLD